MSKRLFRPGGSRRPPLRLRTLGLWVKLIGVSTIAEIERAIERLPAAEVNILAAWLEEFRAGSHGVSEDGRKKSFMQFAGSVEGPVNLSQRKGFSPE